MAGRLRQASMHVYEGMSVVVPLAIDGLPEAIEALGMDWQRKREFHLTAIAARALERHAGDRDDRWDQVTRVASGRSLEPLYARRELRRVLDPDDPALQTLVVMVDAPALELLYRDLSAALEVELPMPPAHVTLYSTDPARGIGITDSTELAARTRELSAAEQAQTQRAMRFERVFADDGTIPGQALPPHE